MGRNPEILILTITNHPQTPLPQTLSNARQKPQYHFQNRLNSPPFTPTSHPLPLLK